MSDIIQTTFSHYGLWTISGRTWRKVFEDMCLVLAWGDPSHPETKDHSVAIAGRQEDGIIDVCDGFNGELDDVLRRAVDFKDLYRITRGYCEPAPPGHVHDARYTDGLTRYFLAPNQLNTLRERYLHDPEHWPHFVSRDHLLSLSHLPENKVRDIESLITRAERLAKDRHVKVARRKWPALFEALNRNRGKMADKSIVRSAAYAVDRLYRKPQTATLDTTSTVYGNLRRD